MPATQPPQAPPLKRRMACWLYEGMLLFGVLFAAAFLFSVLTGMRSAIGPQREPMIGFLGVVLGLYFAFSWSGSRQTLAMKTWDLRLVDRHGLPITPARAAWRYLLSWVWLLPPLALMAPWGLAAGEVAVLLVGWVLVWALLSRFHPQGQFWHDAWAGTRIVHAPHR